MKGGTQRFHNCRAL